MNNFAKTTNYSLVCGLVALAALGCSSSTTPATTGGGGSSSSSGSGGPAAMGDVLMPSATGYVDDTANSGVVGAWYVYGDGFGADGMSASGDCVAKGMFMASQCSQVTSPTPDAPFPPSATGAMCLKGSAAEVIDGPATGPSPGAPDYSDIFGEGIGLDLNSPPEAGAPGFFNASKFTGISFTIDNAQANFRVQFPTSESLTSGDSAFWGSATGVTGSPVMAGVNTFKWADVGGPEYATSPPAFDNTMIQAIQFSVYTDTTAAVPVSFCISNLTLTTD